MSTTSHSRSDDFLAIAGQFKLGALTTESSHPVTAGLSETARLDTAAALRLLFEVDDDVVRTYRAFVESGRAAGIAGTVSRILRRGGRIFFTGCGSTGRLSISSSPSGATSGNGSARAAWRASRLPRTGKTARSA